MARFVRISRAEGIEYLNSNVNWQELRRENRRIGSPDDMDTATIRRYANGLRRLAGQGRWAENLGALRGHTASEHHTGRKRKTGYENWAPPEKIPRMFNEPMEYIARDRGDNRITKEARFTVTAGETVAVRALNQAIQEGKTVALSLSGPLPGEHRFIFWKGGYDPRALLMAAGYRPTKRGRFVRTPNTQGLEAWLINYLTKLSGSPTVNAWAFISLYQIYAADIINEMDLIPEGQQRTYSFPHYSGMRNLFNPFIAPTARPSLRGK